MQLLQSRFAAFFKTFFSEIKKKTTKNITVWNHICVSNMLVFTETNKMKDLAQEIIIINKDLLALLTMSKNRITLITGT